MKRPVYGDLIDEAFAKFKQTIWYKEMVRPFKDKIQYPDNFLRRIFDEGFIRGRESKRKYPLTAGEVIQKQLRYDPTYKNKKSNQ